jgi:Tfp pilus assembly protein PilE
MESIQNGFSILAWVVSVLLVVAILLAFAYNRFKAGGQEKGI